MSPVQPSRSLRWGQSLGTSRKLPFVPQTTLWWSWLSSGSEHSKVPVRRRSECTTTASRESAVSSPQVSLGHPVTSAYWKPWNVIVGSKKSSPPLRMKRSVAWASRSGRTPSSSCSSTSACRIRISAPTGPLTVNRSQPTRFCPKSTSVRPDGERQTLTGRSVSCRVTGRSEVRRQQARLEVEGLDGVEPLRLDPGREPGRGTPAGVDGLPVVQVVGQDVGPARRPRLVGLDPLPVAVREGDLELGDDAEPVAVERPRSHEAQPPAVPPVAHGDRQHRGVLEQRGRRRRCGSAAATRRRSSRG